ncbi:hypothetical protein [Reinekea sp. G2M2-21]|uniref:hypothetical protein n=1 Tax=Reinekea sp. G2M2-21 TaxID=2788942 RepID=UPI0018A8E7FD|nr:hypothetical protein [Reinekea sp. G2M2-21]
MTHTVENHRIRVTVSDNTWNSYRPNAEHIKCIEGDRQTIDQVTRGLVLSTAMSKVGNRSEAALLTAEGTLQFTSVEILAAAKSILEREYLCEHTKYGDQTVMRYFNGHRLSAGMQQEIAEAQAYAEGILCPPDNDQIMHEVTDYFNKHLHDRFNGSAERRFLKTIKLKRSTNPDKAIVAIESAQRSLAFWSNLDIEYRKAHANMDGWLIEIIGEMPSQIGLCRYQGESNH